MNPNKKNEERIKFNQWLAGVIDGDGCFQITKKGYTSLEITMEVRDKHCLYQVKDKFGGAVKLKQGDNWLRYRLHNKKGIINLINSINGLIRNPNRLLQLSKICEHYEIELIYSQGLEYNNGWLSGFIDSDGSIYLNKESTQIFITASQKNKLILDPLTTLYGGQIYTMSKTNSFKWVVFRKDEVLNLLNYFKEYPLRSKKMVRIRLINKIYDAFKNSAHNLNETTIYGKIWFKLLKKWEKYEL